MAAGDPPDARDHHGEREVHGVEAGQPRAEASPADDALRHREHPARHRARRAIFVHHLAREAVDVLRDAGQEHAVLVRPHGPESADELAGVRLAAARDPWHEREEADADPHVR